MIETLKSAFQVFAFIVFIVAAFIGWRRKNKPVLVIALAIIAVNFVLPLLIAGGFLLSLILAYRNEAKLPADTYKSEIVVAQENVSDAYDAIPKQNPIIYYEKDKNTYIRELKTGNEIAIPLAGASLYITPSHEYFFINLQSGKAFIITEDVTISQSFVFKEETALYPISIDKESEKPRSAWLDNHRLLASGRIFDLQSAKIFVLQNSAYTTLGVSVGNCSEGYQCYPLVCKATGPLFDFSRIPNMNSLDPGRPVLKTIDQSELSCINRRISEVIKIDSSPVILLLGVDGDATYNFAFHWNGDNFHDPTAFFDRRKVRSIDSYDENEFSISASEVAYKVEDEILGPCLDNCRLYYHSLKINGSLGTVKGEINREKLSPVYFDQEHREIYFITERGLEKAII